ncbi:hypothetical protein A0256_16315 [Mucilaginibacter sp. PAMC 26640]|nr:hypothetical protein A0256_16315 [Mucilaginibacter sp. PAMC 26640]
MVKEIRSLTGVRGLAALFVAVFHFYKFAILTPEANGSIFYTNSYLSSFLGHGYLSVDLFFILSAFVMTLSSRRLFENGFTKSNYALFMKKRWIRIYPSYFIVLLYGYLVQHHGGRTPNFIVSLTLLNILFGVSFMIPHLWSLTAEWITYLLYPLLLKLCRNARNVNWNYILIFIGILFLYIVALYRWKYIDPPFMLEIYQGYPCLLKCFADYLLGIAAFGLYDQDKLNFLSSPKYSVGVVVLILVSLLFAKLDLLTILLFVFLIIAIVRRNVVSIFLGSKIIYFFGEISYPLYLINFMVYLKLRDMNVLLGPYISDNYRLYILFAIFMFLSIFIAYLFHILIEKPLLNFFNKRLKSNSFPFNFQTTY